MTPTRRFDIEVPEPFRLDLTVWALRRRPNNTMDRFENGHWERVLMIGDRPINATVSQVCGSPSPRVAVDLCGPPGSPLGPAELEGARQLIGRCLGVDVDLADFYRLAKADPRLRGLATRFYGMRPPRFPSVFETLINAIACQQLSLTVGIHLLNRLAATYGPGRRGAPGFPTPERLAEVDPATLRPLGFSRSKAHAICSLAAAVATGQLDLESLAALGEDDARRMLSEIRGVGRWSTEYTLLRGLGRLDILPGDDVGARNNLRRRFNLDNSAGYDEMIKLSQAWWPYGGLVYFHLLLDALAQAGYVATDEAA